MRYTIVLEEKEFRPMRSLRIDTKSKRAPANNELRKLIATQQALERTMLKMTRQNEKHLGKDQSCAQRSQTKVEGKDRWRGNETDVRYARRGDRLIPQI